MLASISRAQTRTVSGTVTDAATHQPLAGVSITVAQSNLGTTTNDSGKFVLNVPANTRLLNLSLVNYLTYSLAVTGEGPFTVSLARAEKNLDDVVVVGYGTQKKRDLTGAVATIGAKDVGGRQTTQVSEALQGSVAGVTVTRGSSTPGGGATIRIRGITSLNSTAPLIIIDGVPANSIDLVNPNDVESLTVLKDAASAAIYGSQGASGVIVITTKRGKAGVSNLDYNYEYGVQQATAQPEYVGIQDYFRYFNEQRINDGGTNFYSDDFINSYLDSNRANPDKFPNTNWQKTIFTHRKAPRQRHDLVFTGGSEKLKTKASLGYNKTGAFYDNYQYERFQFRVNNDLQISRLLSANIDLAYRLTNSDVPAYGPIYDARIFPAWYDDYYDDGRYAPGKDGLNPIAQLREGGTSLNKYNQLLGRIGLQLKPIAGLTITAQVSPTFDWDKTKHFVKPIRYYDKADPARVVYANSTPQAILTETRIENLWMDGQLLANYNKTFGDHAVDIMVGYEEIYRKSESMTGMRTGFPLLDFPYLSAGTREIMESYGGASDLGLHSTFGRLQYNYQGKYYIQGNLRLDQSSRFAPQYRNAWFPSVSAGWTVSEEKFLQRAQWLSFLKLRGSWGQAGNERIDNYAYQALLNFSSALFYQNGVVVPQPGLGQQVLNVENITWETTTTSNIGVDAAFLDNRLTLTGEYYRKATTDILLQLDIPLYIGYDRPFQNAGNMTVKGWEAELGWRDRIGKLRYSVAANLSDARSVVGDLRGTQTLGDQLIQKGAEYAAWYGYRFEGFYQTAAEIAAGPTPLNGNNTKVGDSKYRDISGPDGKPDGKITPDDREILGGSLPRWIYGGNLRAEYGGFDVALTFQGVGKVLTRLNSEAIMPFLSAFGNVPTGIVGKFYSRNNSEAQNLAAVYPRLSTNLTTNNNNYTLSDHWLINGGYFRVKNLTIGYTLPVALTAKAKIQAIRLYVAGNDLFSLSKFPKFLDPESNNFTYPIVRTLMAGASIRF